MDLKHKEVEEWLQNVYDGTAPEYEKSGHAIELLYNLITTVKDSERRAELMVQDCNLRAKEYKAKADEQSAILQGIQVNKSTLSASAQDALHNLSTAANTLSTRSAAEVDVMLGYTNLELQSDKIQQEVSGKKKIRNQLISLSQKLASKIEHALSLERQAEERRTLEARDTKLNEKRERFCERKLEEYEAEVSALEAELSHRGYSKELSHSTLTRDWEKLKAIQEEVNKLEIQLKSYSLPPDVSAAKLQVQQARTQLDALMNDMALQH